MKNADSGYKVTTGDASNSNPAKAPIVLRNKEINFDQAAYGRVVGVTPADRIILKRVSEWMERDNVAGVFESSFMLRIAMAIRVV